MNDDFLYRIRTEPPPHFAHTLKERLDRMPKRGAKLASFGFGLFLFGTAFALVSPAAREMIAAWFGGAQPEVDEVALVAAPAAERAAPAAPAAPSPAPSPADAPPAPSPSPPLPEGEFPPDRAPLSAEVAFAVEMENRRLPPAQRAARAMELLMEVEQHLGVQPPTPSTSSYEETPTTPQDEFITTGPLLAEVGTPAYAFSQRRALFAVMAWTMDPVTALLRRQSEFDDVRKLEVTGKRLEQLARMIPDSFAQDTRLSNVQTRSLNRIWEDPILFAKRVAEMELAARLLTLAAQRGNEIGVRQAAARVASACMTCHAEFRANGNENVGEKYP